MFKKLVPLFIIISFLFGVTCFAEKETQSRKPVTLNLEWSDYGLNFEWAKDKKLLKEMNLTAQQQGELNNLFNESTQTVKTQEEIKGKENELKNQIELIQIIKIEGQDVKTDMAEVEALIDQINKLRNEQYKIRMSAKAKLKILLTEEQRKILQNLFREKEQEQREKMREQMREQMGGREGGGGRRGGGGMPPFQ